MYKTKPTRTFKMNQQEIVYELKIEDGLILYFKTLLDAENHLVEFKTGGEISAVDMTPEIEEHLELQESWLEKMQRPGRVAAIAEEEKVKAEYNICSEIGKKREAALEWIQNMDSREFQDRLLNGNLPEFEREEYVEDGKLKRDTNHSYNLMSEGSHEGEVFNQGYLNRMQLRYFSVEDFKKGFYQEFFYI